MVGIVLDRRREERVDEGRLSQARLASNLVGSTSQKPVMRGEFGTRCPARNNHCRAERIIKALHTMMVKPAPRLATILCRWLGRLAMPIGEALSAAGGAMSGEGEDGRSELEGMQIDQPSACE